MIYFISPNGSDESPGSIDLPWKTVEESVNKLSEGDILYFRGGRYDIKKAVIFQKNGEPGKPIVYSAFEDEKPEINADKINFYKERDKYPFSFETGAFFLYQIAHIIIRGIKITNSHGHGIAIRDSSYVTIDRCITENTFCCGISLWDTHSTAHSTTAACRYNKVTGNTVIKATTWDMLPEGMKKGNEPPHEAISIAGARDFEVAYNHVYNCDKEGIDVKEVSNHGSVHHNHVHHVDRQGLYADAWFGPLTNVDFYDNIVHDCKGAGIVVAVEQGDNVSDIRIYNNNVYDNWGTGILFGIFGADKIRFNIDVFNNIIKRNGFGDPSVDYKDEYFWITGGLCLLSANLTDINIYNNIFENNKGFNIGYSSKYLENGQSIKTEPDINAVFKEKRINIFDNLTLKSDTPHPNYPITTTYENSTLYGIE